MTQFRPLQTFLALDPKAYGQEFPESSAHFAGVFRSAGVASIPITGPLMQKVDPFFDCYEGVRARVVAALDQGAQKIVLEIDSPGGVVSGCFETARWIRDECAARGVKVVAYVDSTACSAAYALACAASEIVCEPSATLGSIGVIGALVDQSAALSAQGVKVALVTSGARKADGDPRIPMSTEAIAAAQEQIDELAEQFFSWVRETRGIDAAAMEAGVFVGSSALARGLCDRVGNFSAMLEPASASAVPREKVMSEEELIAALTALSESEDADEESKARAKRALGAFMDKEEEEASAESKEEEMSAEYEEEKPSATSRRLAVAADSTAKRLAAVERALEASEKARLFDSRPDVADSVKKALASSPLAEARRILSAIPRTKIEPAATAVVQGARGDSQSETGVARLPKSDKLKLDIAMGLVKPEATVIATDTKLILGGVKDNG